MKKEKFVIKPSASIISTIGSELIKDPYAAIIELVKNSYDADSKNVYISFEPISELDNKNRLKITISDDGDGMTPEIIKTAWLVPATKNKLNRRISPSGRHFLGKKGIGRYAASILGDIFSLESVDTSNNKTSINLIWSDFSKYEYLEEVPIFVNSSITTDNKGTTINIIYEYTDNNLWNDTAYFKLIKELMMLVSPLKSFEIQNNNNNDISQNILPFNIFLTILDSNSKYHCKNDLIEPFDIKDFYNYRLYGNIFKNGSVNLTFENKLDNNIQIESINNKIFTLPPNLDLNYCGKIYIDLRVFDRDSSDIQTIMEKNNTQTEKSFLGKLTTRQLLNEVSGIKLYRNNFRIRPYGDPDNDWLNLDKDRVQNPSKNIGNNQICGYVVVENEEYSQLTERSSREGLIENSSYYGLISIIKSAISEIQTRRYIYRKKSGKGRSTKNFNDILKTIVDFKQVSLDINNIIESKTDTVEKTTIVTKILENAEIQTTQVITKLQDIIAIYHGQATLGKIIMVVLHEGRKPIHLLKDHVVRISKYKMILENNPSNTSIILGNIIQTLNSNSIFIDMLANLFKRIEPLSIKSNKKKISFNLSTPIKQAIDIFSHELESKHITLEFISQDIMYEGYSEDIIATFTNLIENSIYWISTSENQYPSIKISMLSSKDKVEIYYSDNGPGIDKTLIESQIIFDPEFTTKNQGTGIGLAICGEAIERNNGTISAKYSDSGAYFIIELRQNKEDTNENS